MEVITKNLAYIFVKSSEYPIRSCVGWFHKVWDSWWSPRFKKWLCSTHG